MPRKIDTNMPTVSIVIPTFNRSTLLENCLKSVLNQDYSSYEIIVVDDGSTDGTSKMLDKYIKPYAEKIILLKQDRKGPAEARNKGIDFAKGKIVLFIDDDVVATPNWISEIIGDFQDPKVGIVGGKTILKRIDTFNVLYHEKQNQGESGNVPLYVPTNNSGFLKEVIEKVNGFDVRFLYPGAEDVDICMRIQKMQYKLRINKKALVYHYESYTFKGWLKKKYEYGYGASTLLDLHPDYRYFYPYYITLPLVLLNDTRKFIENFLANEGFVSFGIVIKIFALTTLQRVYYTLGQLSYIMREHKYKLLFYRMKRFVK